MLPDSLAKVRKAIQECRDKVILTGTIAVSCHVSLHDAEEALNELVHEGTLRPVTAQEMRRTDRVSAYVKV